LQAAYGLDLFHTSSEIIAMLRPEVAKLAYEVAITAPHNSALKTRVSPSISNRCPSTPRSTLLTIYSGTPKSTKRVTAASELPVNEHFVQCRENYPPH